MASINSFERIIELIKTDPNFEHIGHIIHLLDRFDKKRNPEDPDLKSAVFSIVQEILEQKIAQPVFGYSPTGPMPDPVPESSEEVLDYLDRYWGRPEDSDNDIGRAYLIFFDKTGKLR